MIGANRPVFGQQNSHANNDHGVLDKSRSEIPGLNNLNYRSTSSANSKGFSPRKSPQSRVGVSTSFIEKRHSLQNNYEDDVQLREVEDELEEDQNFEVHNIASVP